MQTKTRISPPREPFGKRYDYYDDKKFGSDYLYPASAQLLGCWKHYNLSADTMQDRSVRHPIICSKFSPGIGDPSARLTRTWDTGGQSESSVISTVTPRPCKQFSGIKIKIVSIQALD